MFKVILNYKCQMKLIETLLGQFYEKILLLL